ncbi:MAG TPA: protein phosphatase 2C domain-containing protein [Pseudomonadales bacterium]|nr:protein phosphatase 2C domain-containing protein [Pseudomonadales bacterium]
MHWVASAATHPGAVRKKNEDAYLARTDDSFWLVADGMGGHLAGEVASSMIVDGLAGLPMDGSFSEKVDRIEDCLFAVNDQIRTHSQHHLDGRTMGSTFVSMLANQTEAVCMWVGDSRLYRLRQGSLACLSSDHSQVNEWVQRGLMTLDEARRHPQGNVITRAVGAAGELMVDITFVELMAGDRLLLCSDGLYGELVEEDIRRCLQVGSAETRADALVQAAVMRGARDNVTAIVVQVME